MEQKAIVTKLISTLKIIIFLSFVTTSLVMYYFGRYVEGTLILFAVAIYMLYSRIDAIEKKINGG